MEQLSTLIQPFYIKYALYTMIGLIVAFTIPLFVVLIVHKMRVERRDQKLKELELYYSELLGKILKTPNLAINSPTSDIEFKALGTALADVGINNTRHNSAHLRIIARSTGVDRYYLEMAKSSSWTKRYNAIERLGFLKFPELGPFFTSVLQVEKEPQLLAKTIWAISLIATIDDLPAINKFLGDPQFASSKFKEYIYTNIIQAFRERNEIQIFIDWFSDVLIQSEQPLPLNRDIIEACGAEKLAEAEQIICSYYHKFTDAIDVRISCIRSLEFIGGAQSRHIIHECLQDADWRVRAVAAKHADSWHDDFLPALETLLHDPSYQVRINSAQSLLRCGEKGHSVLLKGTDSDDRFVRDISKFILAEVNHA